MLEKQFKADGLRLNYAAGAGAGPPLLLLHGVTRCWQTFLPLLPAITQRWCVEALDFRGHGGSARAEGRYLVVDYVRDALAFLREQVARPAVLYGHSLGAMVAAAVAAEAPELVRGVVLEDPPFDTMGARIAGTRLHSYFSAMQPLAGSNRPVAQLAAAVGDLPLTDPATGNSIRLGDVRDPVSVRFTAHCLRRLDPDVLAPIVAGRWLDGYDRQRVLGGIRCPMLLVQADESAGGMLTPADAAEVESLVPDCTRVFLPGVGHLVHWARTAETINLTTAFLESLEAAVSPIRR